MSNDTSIAQVDGFVGAVSRTFESDQLIRDDLSRYAVDGMEPRLCVEPITTSQIQAALVEAQNQHLAVVAVGGAHHLGAGNIPSAYDLALSLARLGRIVEHEPADMTVTVETGVQLDTLNAQLAQHGQFLPLDPPCGASATVGGVLAANTSGPRRHAFGTARDWLIGTRVVHPDGTVSKSGGRVVKNVTGYDMHKLYVGSLGTLGVIAEATFKLAPLPRAQWTLAAAFESAQAACVFVLTAHDAGMALHAAEVLSPAAAQAAAGAPHWLVLARVAGGPDAVERSLRDMRRLAGGAVTDLSDGDALWRAWSREFRPKSLSLRASVLPSSVAETMGALERALSDAGARLSATVASGVVRLQSDSQGEGAAEFVEGVTQIVAKRGGSLIVDAAPPRFKQQVDVFGPARADLAIMRRLKDQLDPQRTLAPGRFMGRL